MLLVLISATVRFDNFCWKMHLLLNVVVGYNFAKLFPCLELQTNKHFTTRNVSNYQMQSVNLIGL